MKERVMIAVNKKERMMHLILLFSLLLFFVLMFILYGPGVYNDSDQYIKMHIHREPLYPLFLKLLRDFFGESFLYPMGIIQNAFMAIAIYLLTRTIGDRFKLPVSMEALAACIQVFPHIMTKYFSAMSVFVTNSVMSEALAFPLFTLWTMNALKLLWKGEKKHIAGTLIFSLLLSLTRGQMMVTILVFMLIMLYRVIPEPQSRRKLLRILGVVAVTTALFVARTYAVKCYNLVYNGRFINNTYGNVNLVTNMIYASDREDGEAIREEQTREFFYEIFDKAWAIEGNYSFSGDSLTDRADHIEQMHDEIKFNCIEDTFYQYYDKNVTTDYITQNLLADEQAMGMMEAIFPKCFKNWLVTYCGIVYYGLVRSIAVVHPLINIAAVGIYLLAIVLTVLLWKRNPKSPAVPMMCLALLFIAGNTTAVALTIMCLSRYMIYGFALFYLSGLMVVTELIREWHCAKINKTCTRKEE